MLKSKNKNKTETALTAFLMLVITTILIVIFVILSFLFLVRGSIPEFVITDNGGKWQAQGEIAVFDDNIKPGSEGTYKFIIKNQADVTLLYEFKLTEYIDTVNQNTNPFMQYRLKVDNIPIDDQWHYAGLDYAGIEILSASKHIVTLEWRWLFEDGRDNNDTLIGESGGQLSVWLYLGAEVVYD